MQRHVRVQIVLSLPLPPFTVSIRIPSTYRQSCLLMKGACAAEDPEPQLMAGATDFKLSALAASASYLCHTYSQTACPVLRCAQALRATLDTAHQPGDV